MRRLFVVLFVLAAAGCSSEPQPAATTPPAPLGAPSAPATSAAAGADTAAGRAAASGKAADRALSGNTAAICAQAGRVTTQFGKTFAEDVRLLIDASSKSDPAAADQAKKKTSRDVASYSFALGDMSKLAGDARVAKALGEMSRQVNALKGDVRKLDETKLADLSDRLDEACGTA